MTFDDWWEEHGDIVFTGLFPKSATKIAFEAGKAAEREGIAQMFDAEHEKRQGVDTFAQCAAVAIRARK